mgnify:CR=1 FL=1
MNEDQTILFNKVMEQIEREIANGWIASEVCLSERYEQMGKIYRGKLKNKTPKDRVSST